MIRLHMQGLRLSQWYCWWCQLLSNIVLCWVVSSYQHLIGLGCIRLQGKAVQKTRWSFKMLVTLYQPKRHFSKDVQITCPNMLNKCNKHYLARINECLKVLHVNYIWVTSERLVNTLQQTSRRLPVGVTLQKRIEIRIIYPTVCCTYRHKLESLFYTVNTLWLCTDKLRTM